MEKDTCLYQRGIQCHQESSMAVVREAVDELKEGQKKMIDLMGQIAIQSERTANIGEKLDAEIKDRKHVDEVLFNRIHDLEQAPVAAASNRWTGIWGAVAAVVITVIWELLKR